MARHSKEIMEKDEVLYKRHSITYTLRRGVKLGRKPHRLALLHEQTKTHTQLHDSANHQRMAIYQTVSIHIYTGYFCPNHHKLYMDGKEIYSSLR